MPLRWPAALLDQEIGLLEHICGRCANHYTLTTFDGPLTGGGATLQAGVHQFNRAHRRPYIACWAATWTDEDLARVQVAGGDPAEQARLEAFTLLDVYLRSRMVLLL